MTKKSKIVKLIKHSNDSNDLIALKCDCSIYYVNKIEAEIKRAVKHIKNNPSPTNH